MRHLTFDEPPIANNALSLLELNQLVSDVLNTTLCEEYWVMAELADVNERGGHCYMELIQRGENTNTTVARASARCWRNKWSVLRPYFQRVAGQPLAGGMKLLLKVKANFHENFGFSWIVNDIDPTFTLGDMVRKRAEIIRILKEEGIFDDNRNLPFPLFAQRIAVISSATAAGYGDFSRQLEDNEYGYCFHTELFPAVMQGETVENSVIAALEKVNERLDDFDCVVITRGGGASTDLSGFDALQLARIVAQFQLPVITAIGHDRDESVLDQIACVKVKTPTAAAAFLVDHLRRVDERIEYARVQIVQIVQQRMLNEKNRISITATRITSLFTVVKTQGEARLDTLFQHIAHEAKQRVDLAKHRLDILQMNIQPVTWRILTQEKHRLDLFAQRVSALDPQLLLQRGYSITLFNGKALTNTASLREGTPIETKLANGSFTSVVKTVHTPNSHETNSEKQS